MKSGNDNWDWGVPYVILLIAFIASIVGYNIGWETTIPILGGYLKSNFITALAGAFAGAYGAHFIAVRVEKRKTQLEEIRNINAAIMLSSALVEAFIGLKRQYIKSIQEHYSAERAKYDAIQEILVNGEPAPAEPVGIQLDLRSLPSVSGPIDTLQSILFEKITVTGRPVTLAINIERALQNINLSIKRREELIADIKSRKYPPNMVIPFLYFGVPDANGHLDTSYPDAIDGIIKSTDDGIFYSDLICTDLMELAKHRKKKFGRNAPKTVDINFRHGEYEGLFPDPNTYEHYLDMPVLY